MLPRVLTIAGSDSSGGAGIQADLKTFTVLGVYGMSAITALTAQNTTGVTGIHPIPASFVRQQIDAVINDVGVDAVKTGMLANAEIIEAVAAAVREYRITALVVDPVMVAQSGALLLEKGARVALMKSLLPLACVVTPNIPEAEALLGLEITGVEQMREAARRLVEAGARAVLLKGGHLRGGDAVDVLCAGDEVHEIRGPRIASRHTHGTGCMLSAAITAGLAQGMELIEAVRRAKHFIGVAIENGLPIGRGDGPANPLAWRTDMAR